MTCDKSSKLWNRRFAISMVVMLFACASRLSFAKEDVEVRASFELPRHDKISYGAVNLTDRDMKTAWCASRHENDKREMEIVIDSQAPIGGVGLINGYAKSDSLYKANYRVRRLKVLTESGELGNMEIKDSSIPQWVEFPATVQGRIKLVIYDYYKGNRYNDVCVTELTTDRATSEALANLLLLVRASTNGARSAATSMAALKDFVERYYVSGKQNRAFWNALKVISSNADAGSLRLVLDLSFYAQAGRTIDVELSEGLRDQIVQFIERSPLSVIEVLGDSEQLMRERIVDAYVLFIDPFGSKGFEEMMSHNAALRKLNDAIQEFSKEASR